MKDALGHGSNASNGQAARALASGPKSNVVPIHRAMTSYPSAPREFSRGPVSRQSHIEDYEGEDANYGLPNWPNLYHAA